MASLLPLLVFAVGFNNHLIFPMFRGIDFYRSKSNKSVIICVLVYLCIIVLGRKLDKFHYSWYYYSSCTEVEMDIFFIFSKFVKKKNALVAICIHWFFVSTSVFRNILDTRNSLANHVHFNKLWNENRILKFVKIPNENHLIIIMIIFIWLFSSLLYRLNISHFRTSG